MSHDHPELVATLQDSMLASSVSNLMVLAGTKIAGNIVTFLATAWIARLILPSDRGLLATAVVTVGLLLVVFDVGVDPALQHFGLEPRWTTAHLTVRLISSFSLICLGLGLNALDILSPSLSLAIIGVSVSETFRLLYSTPRVVVELNFNVGRLAVIELSALALGAVAGLALASAGYGWRALIAQLVVVNLVQMLLGFVAARHLLHLAFDPLALWTMVERFGPAGWTGAFSQAFVGFDVLILRMLHGGTSVGFYAQAMAIVATMFATLAGMTSRLILPIFARNRHNPERIAYFYYLLLRTKIFIALPAYLVVGISAHYWFVPLLGQQWSPSLLPFQILVFHMWIILVFVDQAIVPSVIYGRPRIFATTQVVYGVTFLALAVPLILLWSATGAAVALLMSTLIACVRIVRMNLELLHIELGREYVVALLISGLTYALAIVISSVDVYGEGLWLALLLCLAGAFPFLTIQDAGLRKDLSRLISNAWELLVSRVSGRKLPLR